MPSAYLHPSMKLVVYFSGILLLGACPVVAQVAGGADEIEAYFENHALTEWILDDLITEFVEEQNASARENPQAPESVEWLSKTAEERVEHVRGFAMESLPYLDRLITEWFPELGTLSIMRSPLAAMHQSDGYRFHESAVAINEADGVIFLMDDDGGKREVTFFDGSKITLSDPVDAEMPSMSYVAVTGQEDVAGRAADASLLIGTWKLVQLDAISLEDYSPLAFEFRREGSFTVSGGGGTTPEDEGGRTIPPYQHEDGEEENVGDPPVEIPESQIAQESASNIRLIGGLETGRWGLSSTRVKPKHGEPENEEDYVRILVMGGGAAEARHLFLVDELSESSLVLTWYGKDGVSALQFRR